MIKNNEHKTDFNYDNWIQESLKDVINKALKTAENKGLNGGHLFYINFQTNHQNVVMPNYLKAKYPLKMIIVLENEFWNLKVLKDSFSVELGFNGKHEFLSIPFDAVLSFSDPSVNVGFNFDIFTDEDEMIENQNEFDKKDGKIIKFPK